ncbi:MAG: hypothetical protein HY653_07270 [Acidobacteria bacterium]|nr:hypothetical protein [Acidobacteriota bacterium]
MRRMGVFFVAVSLVLLALPALAQQEGQNVSRAYWVKPKAGMELQYEEAYKKHIAWHRQQKDTWTWTTFQVEAGDGVGQFITVTAGHRWADFDKPSVSPDADRADALANTGPYTESVRSVFSVFRGDISRPPAPGQVLPVSQTIRFHLNPGRSADFAYVVRKVHEAIGKTNRPGNYFWLERVAGEETPTFVLVLPRKDWADFEPQATPIWEMMEEVYGRQEAEELRALQNKAIHCTSSYILRHRPDLSYTPAPAAK